jgi:hypothetical protein
VVGPAVRASDTEAAALERLESEARRCNTHLREANASMRKLQARRGTGLHSVCAYVTFQEEKSFLKCLQLYPRGWVSWAGAYTRPLLSST